MKKQWLIGAAAAALIAGLAGGYGILENRGAAGADNEPEIVLCYGEVNPEGHVLTDSAQYFADRVSELTGGKVMVEIYPSGQLGMMRAVTSPWKWGRLICTGATACPWWTAGIP